jgi:hypothetical protein
LSCAQAQRNTSANSLAAGRPTSAAGVPRRSAAAIAAARQWRSGTESPSSLRIGLTNRFEDDVLGFLGAGTMPNGVVVCLSVSSYFLRHVISGSLALAFPIPPDAITPRRFLNAHHDGLQPTQLEAV